MREVDDALREDQMLTAFKRYGAQIGVAVLTGLVALGGYLWWQDNSRNQTGQRAEQLSIALDRIEAGQLDAGLKGLGEISTEPGASGVAATLMRAGVLAEQGKPADAARIYAAVAANSAAPQVFRDLAQLREVAVTFDTLAPQQVIDKLKPLAVPGNAWFGSAGEMTAMAQLKAGRKDLAGALFAAVSRDKTSPESLRNRTRQMAGLLGVDAIDDVAAIVGTEPAQAGPPAPQAAPQAAQPSAPQPAPQAQPPAPARP